MKIKITEKPKGRSPSPEWFLESLIGLEFSATRQFAPWIGTVRGCYPSFHQNRKECFVIKKQDLVAVLEQNGLQSSVDYITNKLKDDEEIIISKRFCEEIPA